MSSEKRAVRKKARKRKRYLKNRPRTTLVTGKGDNVKSAKKAHRQTMKNARINRRADKKAGRKTRSLKGIRTTSRYQVSKKKAIRRSKVKDARATKRASVKKARRSTMVPQKRRQAVRKARRTKRKSVKSARKGY